jgi:hypothetical protein
MSNEWDEETQGDSEPAWVNDEPGRPSSWLSNRVPWRTPVWLFVLLVGVGLIVGLIARLAFHVHR